MPGYLLNSTKLISKWTLRYQFESQHSISFIYVNQNHPLTSSPLSAVMQSAQDSAQHIVSAPKNASDDHNDSNNDEKHFDDVSLAVFPAPPIRFEFITYAAVHRTSTTHLMPPQRTRTNTLPSSILSFVTLKSISN